MAEPIVARYQFELRYHPIFNFSSSYKDIVAPYVRNSQAFQIEDSEYGQEKVVMRYDEHQLVWEVRWDRMFFLAEGDVLSLSGKDSFAKLFFELFEKFREMTGFGSLRTVFSRMHCVVPRDSHIQPADFAESIGIKSLSKQFNLRDLDDIAITIERKFESNSALRMTYGPFNGEEDIVRHKLLPMESVELKAALLRTNGILVDSLVTDNVQNADYRTLADAIKLQLDAANNLVI